MLWLTPYKTYGNILLFAVVTTFVNNLRHYVCGGILNLKLSYLDISLWELAFAICACCVDTGGWLANASGTANLN